MVNLMHLSGAIHLPVVLQVTQPRFALSAPAYLLEEEALLEHIRNFTMTMSHLTGRASLWIIITTLSVMVRYQHSSLL